VRPKSYFDPACARNRRISSVPRVFPSTHVAKRRAVARLRAVGKRLEESIPLDAPETASTHAAPTKAPRSTVER
jgi:hypothetical protein